MGFCCCFFDASHRIIAQTHTHTPLLRYEEIDKLFLPTMKLDFMDHAVSETCSASVRKHIRTMKDADVCSMIASSEYEYVFSDVTAHHSTSTAKGIKHHLELIAYTNHFLIQTQKGKIS